MASLPSTSSLTLDLPPSCIAFCPSKPHFFVVGTYLLHPKEQLGADARPSDAGAQLRTGSLILFRLETDEVMTRIGTVPTESAILDVQWSPHGDGSGDVLAVATSTGRLLFYRLHASGDGDLILCGTKTVADPSVLVLALAWHPERARVIGLTLSDGRVCLCESTGAALWGEDSGFRLTTVHNHTLEAWTLAFAGPTSTDVLSGGDDCVLQFSTLDCSNEGSWQWRDGKLHDAGITAILPLTAQLVVTGSYDDKIRLVSLPTTGRRTALADLNLGGGVWRIKALSTTSLPVPEGEEPEITSLVILASCMHAGSRVVRVCKGGNDENPAARWQFEVLARFEEHRSMNYGADFQPADGTEKRIVSISFYDRRICLWRFDVDKIGAKG